MSNELIRQNYIAIANAIREKTGTTGKLTANEMPEAIANITTGVQDDAYVVTANDFEIVYSYIPGIPGTEIPTDEYEPEIKISDGLATAIEEERDIIIGAEPLNAVVNAIDEFNVEAAAAEFNGNYKSLNETKDGLWNTVNFLSTHIYDNPVRFKPVNNEYIGLGTDEGFTSFAVYTITTQEKSFVRANTDTNTLGTFMNISDEVYEGRSSNIGGSGDC